MTSLEQSDTGQVHLTAIAMLIIGLFAAALNGALMKELSGVLPALMIIWGRYTAYLLIMLPIALVRHGVSTFFPPRPALQLVRVLLLLIGTACFITGVKTVPYADAIAIIYVYPFVLTALSPFFLDERVSKLAWIGVFAGFAGVVIVMRPSPGALDFNALLILACGLLLGVHLMMTRLLVRGVSPVITSTYTALVIVVVTTALLLTVWQPMDLRQAGLLALLGAVSAVSQWFVLLAFSKAPAPLLAPFSYAEIPAAVLLGLAFFGEWPDAVAWFGIAVIIASGVVVARGPARAAALARKRRPVV